MRATGDEATRPAGFGPLQGLRVLDLTQAMAGPFGTQVLADLGAEVVKLEAPAGDSTRRAPTFHPDDVARKESGYFHSINRNKKSIVLDLKSPEGAALVKRLAPAFEVVTENFRAGVMERLGLSYETLSEVNPRLVYAALRGYGDPKLLESPYASWPAFDVTAQAMGGLMGVTGPDKETPTKVGPGIGDAIPGLYMAIGVLAAVMHARRTGVGQFLDVAMLDCMLGVSERIVQQYYFGGVVPEPEGSHHPYIVPFGVFPARDGAISLACPDDDFFRLFCEAIGAEDFLGDPVMASASSRLANRNEAIARIGERTRVFSKSELMARLGGKAPYGPVYAVDEIAADPHFKAREMLVDLPPRDGLPEGRKVVGVPIKLQRTPGRVAAPGPSLGADTRSVLLGAGFDASEIDDLMACGIARESAT